MDFVKMNKVLENVVREVAKIDDVTELSCVLGCVVDTWGAMKNLTNDEIFEIFERLAEVQKTVYEVEGRVAI